MKRLSLMLALVLILLLAGCQQGGEPQGTTTPQETTTEGVTTTEPQGTQNPVAAKYETVAFENLVIHPSESVYVEIWTWGEQNVFFIDRRSDLEPFGLEETLNYEESFFEEKSLIFFRFVRKYSEEIVELTGIAVKDGTLCPVLTIDPPGPGENSSTSFVDTLITVEVEKDALNGRTAGEILIINLTYPDQGSWKYHKFE
ncbi:MAG: hypothetical protein IJY42_00950 [Clostridia bacterium]|nr:hypothetical protein [Clostridia bacterium]